MILVGPVLAGPGAASVISCASRCRPCDASRDHVAGPAIWFSPGAALAQVVADHHDPPVTADHLALVADLLDASAGPSWPELFQIVRRVAAPRRGERLGAGGCGSLECPGVSALSGYRKTIRPRVRSCGESPPRPGPQEGSGCSAGASCPRCVQHLVAVAETPRGTSRSAKASTMVPSTSMTPSFLAMSSVNLLRVTGPVGPVACSPYRSGMPPSPGQANTTGCPEHKTHQRPILRHEHRQPEIAADATPSRPWRRRTATHPAHLPAGGSTGQPGRSRLSLQWRRWRPRRAPAVATPAPGPSPLT